MLLALNVFILLGSYYLLKTVREALILSEKGAEVKSYSGAAQAVLLLLIVPAYGMLASKVNRIRLISWVTLFFVSNLATFYFLGHAGRQIGVSFFIWVGIFNVLVVAQFWGFANDLYTQPQGKRLFPIVGVGASLGAWVGAIAASRIFPVFGPYGMMMVASTGLVMCIILCHISNHRERIMHPEGAAIKAEAPLDRKGGFKLVLTHRYLLLIAILTVVLNISNTTGEYMFGRLVTEHAKAIVGSAAGGTLKLEDLIARTYGEFYSWVNLLGLVFQLFLVSRIFRYLGVRGALFILPCISLGVYGLIAAVPVLRIVRFGKMLENSTDYSIQNTTRHALFLPTSREAKYKAQAAIETFFWRAGDVLQAALVFGGSLLAWKVRDYASVNIVLVIIWLWAAWAIYREHKRLVPNENTEPVQSTPA
ncbi:MAG: carrier protein family protein, partial [Bryobacterales bacterium]|nr:carrier protein family protein [Bryobacterales bacterium]